MAQLDLFERFEGVLTDVSALDLKSAVDDGGQAAVFGRCVENFHGAFLSIPGAAGAVICVLTMKVLYTQWRVPLVPLSDFSPFPVGNIALLFITNC